MQKVIYTEKCTGCRSCEIACVYHHRRFFSRKNASIEIKRREREGEFGIVLYRHNENGHLACDCTGGDEFCLKYCPEIARDELKGILKSN
jgi:Fe-S-cluster-containing dehydrogenase component